MIADCEDVIVRGARVQNCGHSGVAVLASRDVTVSEVASRFNHNGVLIQGPRAATRNIAVTGCRIAENRWSGVYVCGDGQGADVTRNGPENVTIANNFIFRHMCDEGIKLFGAKDAIVTGNRVDYALEATISVGYGNNCIVSQNICSHGDDGMNNKGNGGGIAYSGPADGTPINAVIVGNICREGNNGIWSESFGRSPDGKVLTQGNVTILGNICHDNVTVGLGQIQKSDLTCVGNVCVNNGHSTPEPGSPAADTMGLMVGGGTVRHVLMGNVVSDTREGPAKRMASGIILRGCDQGIIAGNYASGAKEQNIREQNPGKGLLKVDNLANPLP
jgi:hypothetical protein